MMDVSPDVEARFGPDPEAAFRANLADVESRIAAACVRAGRPRASVRLLPVTKTVPAELVRLAPRLGLTTLGENKVQEADGKARALADLGLRWAIIGHLQTNKIKSLVNFASEFHALDSLRVAEALNARLAAEGRTLDVFVQVNTSEEESKYGLSPGDVESFVARLPEFTALVPRGLMTLALFSGDMARIRPCFRLLRGLRDQLRERFPETGLTQLSMGMSGDFEAAIEEGADIVRVGQAIFGPRPTGPGHYWPGVPQT